MIKEYGRIQIAAQKQDRSVVFDLKIFEKKTPKKRKLLAETQCTDPNHFIIQFYIKEADSIEEIMERFSVQLTHRGFTPERVRTLKRGWGPWEPFPGMTLGA